MAAGRVGVLLQQCFVRVDVVQYGGGVVRCFGLLASGSVVGGGGQEFLR